ncbi:MAG TPA: Gfo/Idh/MocA family oxidoreductase [Trueperaceae bacterium]|nr:Gfo/Idh/MocA family oxidoreductase [Trueperaceae bacterium]
MIIVDTALRRREEEGRPVRVAMVGAGFMAKGVANQVVNSTPGMRLVGIANRTPKHAEEAYAYAGVTDVALASTAAQVASALEAGRPVVTDDPLLLARADGVDVVLEATGAVEYGAHAVVAAIAAGKHVVLLNAELDGTVGPILKVMADEAGVVYAVSDGDQPGVQANLIRFVKGIGLEPLVAGNVKGLQDPYRNPTTQKAFAERWGQRPSMVTSFADGTKISFEQANVANAFGFTIERRGMMGREHREHVDTAVRYYDVDKLRELGGVVDYLVGALPSPGVFVFATHDDPKQRHYLSLYKLGEGPLYSFYTPYHLCHFEVPNSLARAVLFGDAALAPSGPMRVEVVTTAKRDLQAGEVLDGLGEYMTYGQCETAAETERLNLLPIGLAEGCRLKRAVAKDQVITYDDVELPQGRLIDELRARQARHFGQAGGSAPGQARGAAPAEVRA